jgi:5'-nucleotidase
MEGVTLGVPSVAISFAGPSSDLEALNSYRDLLKRLVRRIVDVGTFPPETLLNINLPPGGASSVRGIKVTTLGSRYFSESLTRIKDPWGREIFWIGGGEIHWTGGAESDHHAIAEGYISITPLHMDLTDYRLLETVRGWSLEG